MRGAGVGACMLGRRRVSHNVLNYCMMLFCRLMFLTGGGVAHRSRSRLFSEGNLSIYHDGGRASGEGIGGRGVA